MRECCGMLGLRGGRFLWLRLLFPFSWVITRGSRLCRELLKRQAPQRLFPWSLKKHKFTVGEYRLKDGSFKTRWSIQTAGTKRAWQITKALLPQYTQHWLRAFGYNYDYDHMEHDIMVVSDKTKADPRSLQPYLRRRYEKYPVR